MSKLGGFKSHDERVAEALGLEGAELQWDEDEEENSPPAPLSPSVRSPPASRAYVAPAAAATLGRSFGGGGFGHAAASSTPAAPRGGGVGGGDGGGAPAGAVAVLLERVQELEGSLAAAQKSKDSAKATSMQMVVMMQKAQKAGLEKLAAQAAALSDGERVVSELRKLIAASEKAAEAARKTGGGGEGGGGGAPVEDSPDAAPEALRAELRAVRGELAERAAAEREVRARARAARLLAAEVAAAGKGGGGMEAGALRGALERFSGGAAAGGDEDYVPGGGRGGGAGGGGGAAAAAPAPAYNDAGASHAALARALGDAARAREEAAALRDKVAALRGAEAVAARGAAEAREAAARAAAGAGEAERLRGDVDRLSRELEAARGALNEARGAAAAGSAALVDLVTGERDAARAEAEAARAAAAAAEGAHAEARRDAEAAAAEAGASAARAAAAEAAAAAAEARAADAAAAVAIGAAEAGGGEGAPAAAAAAAARVEELEAALAVASAKAREDREKLKKKAHVQFEQLKATALAEIEAEKEKVAVLSAERDAAAARAAGAGGAAAALRAAKGGVGGLRAGVRALRSAVASELEAAAREQAELMGTFQRAAGAVVAKAKRAAAGEAERLRAELGDVTERYRRVDGERRKWFNMVQELRGNIRVYARVRPTVERELATGDDSVAVAFPIEEGTLSITNSKRATKVFEFDMVFKPATRNDAVYREVEGMVASALDGYNTCIFAYGQTGSGKTFTMEGVPEQRGINYCALGTLFDGAAARRADGWAWEFQVALLEIYNEEIRDMLAEKGPDGLPLTKGKLKARESPTGMEVPGLVLERVSTAEETLEIMRRAYKNRTTFATDMNAHSSRSHALLSVYVSGTNRSQGVAYRGKLHLVDLAGSERISRSGAQGDRLKEAQAINTSLSALGDVIQARAAKQKHVPFRNSTLTWLLSDSLSNDSKTLMFVNLSPMASNADESICSMNFASRVRTVELGKATKHVSAAGGGGGEAEE